MNIFDLFGDQGSDPLAGETRARSYQNQSDLRIVEEKVDNLALICQAMWELLEETGYTRAELLKKIQEIDLRDGKIDGKITKVTHCPQCNHKLGKRINRCLWCGAHIEQNNFISRD